MIFCQTIKELNQHLETFKGETVGFVPTMGAFHDGHLDLIKRAKKKSQKVVVSIFVNPTQFTNNKDFEMYPRTIEEDIKKLKFSSVDILFCPSVQEIYNSSISIESILKKEAISLPTLFSEGEGAFRPGHFEGVYMVLYRLFSIIRPNIVFFGEKDFQQTLLVKHLIKTTFRKIFLEVVPTVRLESGLAYSSRNTHLSSVGLKKSKVLFQSLQSIKSAFMNGEKKTISLIQKAEGVLKQELLVEKIEYIEIRDPQSFALKKEVEIGDIVLISVFFEGVRLIDNFVIGK